MSKLTVTVMSRFWKYFNFIDLFLDPTFLMLPSVLVWRADLLFMWMNLSHLVWTFYVLPNLCGFSTSVPPTNLKLLDLGSLSPPPSHILLPTPSFRKTKKQPGNEWYLSKQLRFPFQDDTWDEKVENPIAKGSSIGWFCIQVWFALVPFLISFFLFPTRQDTLQPRKGLPKYIGA